MRETMRFTVHDSVLFVTLSVSVCSSAAVRKEVKKECQGASKSKSKRE